LRLLSTLLTEMDGMELATGESADVIRPLIRHPRAFLLYPPVGVLVLAATNRPSAIDDALMRPGRLDVQLYVPPPDLEGRLEVLKVHTMGMPLADDVDLGGLAADTDRFSGMDVRYGCQVWMFGIEFSFVD
jgi:SpoVK/Ycf46/Vps4 family AAA+-type ATPase